MQVMFENSDKLLN